jgi:hypothetical protein
MPVSAYPSVPPQTTHHSGAGPIMNIMMYNEIGNDNHTSVETRKKSNSRLIDSCPVNERLMDFALLVHRNMGPG